MRTGMFVSFLNLVLCGTFLLPLTGQAQNDVTFQVNMSVKMLEGVFVPENGDRLVLHGDYNGWSGTNDQLEDSEADSIYNITVNLDAVGDQQMAFKYAIFRQSGFPIYENFIANRILTMNGSPQTRPVVFFDDDQVISSPAETGKIKFFVDMQVMRELGLFQADSDIPHVLAPFNGWGYVADNAELQQNAFDADLFAINATVMASPDAPVLHRFAMATPGVTGQPRYEFPLTTGGIRREVAFAATANQNAQIVYFNDVPPQGIVPASQTVQCTFQVDMRPAMLAGEPAFQQGRDKLYVVLTDAWWAGLQGRETGVQNDWRLVDTEGDSIFEVNATVRGPSPYGLIYRYGYGPRSDSLKIIEGGDFEVHPSRVRYIQPKKANDFPASFVFPQDIWQDMPGLPVEAPPFSPLPPANKPPYVINTIPSQTIPLNNSAFNIDLVGSLNVFHDPNGDELTFSAAVYDEAILQASINGSLLTIQPLQIGTTTVQITADDKKGGTAETSFSVSVVEGNQPPRVINTINRQILTVGGSKYSLNLGLVFEDPNSDPMTYRAISSAPHVATAAIFAGVLRVTPLLVGTTTITITAEDNRGGAIGTSFLVEVVSGNQAPRVENEISSQTLTVSGSPYIRDLNASPSVFSDPNGDTMNYSTTSSNNSVASGMLSGSTLIVSAYSVGSADITVFANDGNGGSVSTQFDVVTVSNNSNHEPQIANAIDSQILIEGGAPFSRNLDQPPTVFRDQDSDPMFYTATSTNSEVADVTIFGSLLSVAPTKQGIARIEVTATDGFGGSQTMKFDVRVTVNQPPAIQHVPTSSQSAGQPIVVDASISDDTGVTSAIIHYRRGGDSNFSPVAMTNIGGSWQGTIPGGDVTSRGIEYVLEAFDQLQASSVSALSAVPVALTGEGEHQGSTQYTGKNQNAYRLFSIPFQLYNADPADVLVDDLGTYDIQNWRFFELTEEQSYAEFSEAGQFVPGKAFWLIVNEPGKLIDSGAGVSNRTDRRFAIPLYPQWNFIANPFNFIVPVTKLQLASRGESPEILEFNGSWSDAGSVSEIKPFAGYALFSNTTQVDTLYVDPQMPVSTGKTTALSWEAQLDWSVRIIANGETAVDRDNVLGTSVAALNGYDWLDKPEPPLIGNFVRVQFNRPDWQALTTAFSTDIRGQIKNGAVWEFQVSCAKRQIVNLKFVGLATLPSTYEAYLIDENASVAKKLQENETYSLVAPAGQRAKTLKIAVGKSAYLSGLSEIAAMLPANFELAQNYPNPFNPVTTIRFGLPREAEVSLEIYSVMGERVAELLNAKKLTAGYHTAVWNGKSSDGIPASSGVYFYRLKADAAEFVKKMTLVK